MLDHDEEGNTNDTKLNNGNDSSFGSVHHPFLELLDLLVDDTHLFCEDNNCECDSPQQIVSSVIWSEIGRCDNDF